MAIKTGDVAFVKTTEEPVYILGIQGEEAYVRRPIAGQNGITHVKDTFLVGELEDGSEQKLRMLNDRKSLMDSLRAGEAQTDQTKLFEA